MFYNDNPEYLSYEYYILIHQSQGSYNKLVSVCMCFHAGHNNSTYCSNGKHRKLHYC